MQVTVEQLEPCKVAVSVEIDAETVGRTFDKVYEDVARQVAVPGFRKGRAPRPILERFIDADLIRERAISALVPDHYRRALEEQGLAPVGQPEFNLEDLAPDQPFHFTATVPTQPVVRLCEYHGIPARRRGIPVTEEDVAREMERVRQRSAHLEDLDAEVAGPGMVAVADLHIYRGGRMLKNRSTDDTLVDMDDTQSVPAFNLTIEGMRVGETREMPVHYPQTHSDQVLAGKDVTFRITLKGLKNRVVPELNDEFARQAAGAGSVDELRARVRESLERAAVEVANREVRDQLVEYVVSRSEVDFPDVLVQEHVAGALREQREDLEKRGVTLEDYVGARGTDVAGLERELREDARRRIRTQLVLEEIAIQEEISASEEDVNAEVQRMARSANMRPDQMLAALERSDSLGGVRVQIVFRKVVDHLLATARVSDE